ncbi:MAG: hypothetical protein WAO69_04175 [Aestuariivita sp.]|uniref:hypothetical protein n=1 Tax=Aestuariivita sp. TaxID=1872407 RepID=UPI003BAE9AEF
MTILAYVLPLICIAIGYYLGYNLALRGRLRPIGILFLLAAAGFWLCIQLSESNQGMGGVGYQVVALMIIMPGAGGLFMGLVIGWVRRRRHLQSHG